MRSKSQYPIISLKLILICFFFIFLLFLILRSSFSSTQQNPSSVISASNYSKTSKFSEEEEESTAAAACPTTTTTATTRINNNNNNDVVVGVKSCNKISPSLAQALVHYATSNITPQQTFKEISVTLRVLEKKSPCNLLVFGLGHDSLMWASLNHGGRTVFLEEDKSWIDTVGAKLPTIPLQSHHVVYDTKVTQAEELLKAATGSEDCKVVGDPRFSKCQLALKGFPEEIYEIEWDLIMVDAPTGYFDGAPGRMSAIYTAGLMARNREDGGETHVFVHDVDRQVEDKFSNTFLCQGYLREQQGRLRHFTIPSHRTRPATPFCP